MKIRIRGNSIRLRLTKSEVSTFNTTGSVSDQINFGLQPTQQLIYALIQSDVKTLKADFDQNKITIHVPSKTGNTWANSDEVGMTSQQHLEDDQTLTILVEKDFQCLKVRLGEEDADTFPNPDAI